MCFAIVLALHGAVAASLLTREDDGDAVDSEPAITIDFAALPTPQAPLQDVAPGPEQVEAESTPEVRETKTEQQEQPVDEKAEITPQTQEAVPVPDLTEVPDSEVAIATVMPKPRPKEEKAEEEPEEKRPPTPATVGAIATTAPTSAAARNAAIVSWKSRLATHLQRHKRYPAAAQSRGEQGTALVRFSIDRSGRVLSSTLVRSSGSTLLDKETMELVRRCEPFPRPPESAGGTQFTFSVPVRFSVK
jgi:protein TonB